MATLVANLVTLYDNVLHEVWQGDDLPLVYISGHSSTV